ARSSSPALNLLLCLVVGVTQGVFEVVINFGAVRLEKAGQSRVMSLLHAGFSVGAVLGPVGISFFLSNGSSWKLVFPVLAILYLVLAALFAVTPFFGPEPVAADRERRGIALLRQPLFLLLSLAALFYVGSELGASNWISEYFVKVLGTSPGTGAYAVSILWAGILVGRTLVSALFHEKREEWVVFVLSLSCVAALLGLTASRSPVTGMLVVFALGLGYSGIYPLLMSITGKAFRTTASVGMFTTVAGIGSFSFPFLLAGISQGAGLRAGFLLLAILPLGTLAISVAVARHRRDGRLRDTTRA
ncbi:MAG TPA: MFS transporter, partial [Spirochaetia bacterium]